MGRHKKYTKKTLREAVRLYFDSISREVQITEKQDTGEKDRYGHTVYRDVPVLNKLGMPAAVTEYLVPPTLGGLCLHLGIRASTWGRWRDVDTYPEYTEIIEEVDDRLIAWRKEQVVSRKHISGLIWDLETNFGCGAKQQSGDEGVRHGVVILPQIAELTPPEEDGEIQDG